MPFPIIPTKELGDHSGIFGAPIDPRTLTKMQQFFLGFPEDTSRLASVKYDARTIEHLEAIFKNSDADMTKLAEALSDRKEPIFRVPEAISDYDMLSLKTAGLIIGQGRTVGLTDKGIAALRNKWLSAENRRATSKAKGEFVHPWRTADDENGMRRFASDEPELRRFGQGE